MSEIVGLEFVIGANVDNATSAFDKVVKSAGTTAASITASMTKATGSISAIAPAVQKAASGVNIIGISFDKAAAKVDEISSAIANIPQPSPIIVDVIADTDEAIAAIKNIPTGAINLQATGIPNLSGVAEQLEATTIQATKLDSALENVAASAGSTGAAISLAMGRAADAINKIPDAAIKVDASISQIPVEATQAAVGINKISTAISQVSSSSVNEFGTIVRGFDSIESEIDQIANNFYAKWNPVFDTILKTTVPIETVSTAFAKLKSNVASFGGGILTINTTGVKEVIADVSKLSISVKEIPPINLGLAGSTEIIKVAADVELLVNDLVKLGSGGSASVSQLTQALNLLKTAQATTTDTTAFNIYQSAIDKITTSVNVLKTNVASFGGGVLKFDTTGIKEAVADINKLSAIKPAPVKIDIIVSQEIQTALVGMEHLSEEIRQLATGGVTNISQLTVAIKTLKTASLSATDIGSVAKYNSAIEKLTGQVTKIKGVTIPAGAAISGVGKSSNTASFALQGLSRVAQDVPFGFIGIANNLNPLLEGFQNLAKEAKITGVSVGKSLIKELTGAGGLGLALGVVSAALTIASVGMSAWTRGFGGAAKAADELADAQKKAFEGTASEIVNLRVLEKVATDITVPYDKRIKAVDELQKLFPSYLGNLKDEAILNGEAAKQINAAADALAKKAYYEAASSKLTGIATKDLEAKQKEIELVNELRQAELDLAVAKAREKAAPTQAVPGASSVAVGNTLLQTKYTDILDTKIKGLTESLFENRKEQQGFTKDLQYYINVAENFKVASIDLDPDPKGNVAKTKTSINEIQKVLSQLIIDRSKLADDPLIQIDEKPLKEISLIQDAIGKLRDLKVPQEDTIIQKLIGEIGIGEGFADPATLLQQVISKQINDFTKNVKPEEIAIPIEITLKPQIDIGKTIEDIQKQLSLAQKKIKLAMSGMRVKTSQGIDTTVDLLNDAEVNSNFDTLDSRIKGTASLFQDLLGPAFTSAFDALANGSNVMEAIGQSLRQMITRLIAAAAQAAVLSLILSTIFPGAAPSFGALFGQLAGIPRFETGGIATQATLGIFGERGAEAILPLDRLKDYMPGNDNLQPIVLDTRISGNDIWLSQQRTQAKRGRTF